MNTESDDDLRDKGLSGKKAQDRAAWVSNIGPISSAHKHGKICGS